MGAFVISKRFNDTYKFVFTSRKGKVIFTSQSYELKFEGEEDIALIKASLREVIFVKVKSAGGKFFFKLLLGERQMATSRKYTTELRLIKGINEIQSSAILAEILDFSNDSFVFPD
ncbi:MAG: DUF1508 domain-containing protein [Flavobacterium sp.]